MEVKIRHRKWKFCNHIEAKIMLIFFVRPVTVLLLCAYGLSSTAGNLPYDKSTAQEYLASREAIYLVVKVGGWLSYNEYKGYFVDYENYTYSKWESVVGDRSQKFLVLKSYKNGENVIGETIQAQQVSDYGLTELGKKYILFLNVNRDQLFGEIGSYYFGDCEAIRLDDIPKELVSDLPSVLGHVSKSTLNP